MTNRLIEIGRDDLEVVKNLYKLNRFRSEIGYMTLKNYAQWFEQDQQVKHIHIFCLNGDFSDGTFVLIVCVGFLYHTFKCQLLIDDLICRIGIEHSQIHWAIHLSVSLSCYSWSIIQKVFDSSEFAQKFIKY